MERIFYTINEKSAKTAHEMMSMSDYKEGSKTAEYRGYVNEAYDLADKIAEAKPKEADRVYALAERYSRKMAEYMNKEISIGLRCPSVMISGAGNFPVKKKEKQVAAWEKNHEFYQQVKGILDKMKNIMYGKEQIKSGDADAIERLEEKLESLRELQETMKAVNKAIRLKDTEKGDNALRDMGYSDEQIKELRKPDFCGRVGFPDYALQNNNANIHRVEDRLKRLKAAKEKGTQETENDFFKVIRNAEAMRLQIIFDGKPEPEIREILKKNGFRWAPSNGAWQRHLNGNSEYALNQVIKGIKKLQGAEA
ncbi:MAG: hypothetical protein Q4C77_03840 [Eubacteriales bacterium]|nr:hypothetical protein [Eubacteriales bacterium]